MSASSVSPSMKCTNTVAAAATLHTSLLAPANKSELRNIMKAMGNQGDISISFVVTTDQGGSQHHVGQTIMYHAANAYFQLKGRQVLLNVNLAKYQEGRYLEPVEFGKDQLAISQVRSDEVLSVGRDDQASREVAIARDLNIEFCPIVDAHHQVFFDKALPEELPPVATQVVNLIHKSFPNGIPLPSSDRQRVLRCFFQVEVLHAGAYERLMLCKGIQGDIIGGRYKENSVAEAMHHSWSRSVEKRSSGIENMQHRKEIAQGKRHPDQVPVDAQQVAGKQIDMALVMESRKPLEASEREFDALPRIEEIE